MFERGDFGILPKLYPQTAAAVRRSRSFLSDRFCSHLLVGSSDTSIREILAALFRPDTVNPRIRVILWTMRLPAGVMGLLVGAALGTAGAAMQTILNNPLASPYTLGISAGAGFGASLALLGGLGSLQLLGNFLVPVSAFAFAILTCLGIYAVSKRQNFSSAAMVFGRYRHGLFLSGSPIFSAISGFPEALQSIIFWTFGSLSKADWRNIPILAAVFAFVFLRLLQKAWCLTALKLGESRARALGVDTEGLRREMFFLISL